MLESGFSYTTYNSICPQILSAAKIHPKMNVSYHIYCLYHSLMSYTSSLFIAMCFSYCTFYIWFFAPGSVVTTTVRSVIALFKSCSDFPSHRPLQHAKSLHDSETLNNLASLSDPGSIYIPSPAGPQLP